MIKIPVFVSVTIKVQAVFVAKSDGSGDNSLLLLKQTCISLRTILIEDIFGRRKVLEKQQVFSDTCV